MAFVTRVASEEDEKEQDVLTEKEQDVLSEKEKDVPSEKEKDVLSEKEEPKGPAEAVLDTRLMH